jgi:hypothetical protein
MNNSSYDWTQIMKAESIYAFVKEGIRVDVAKTKAVDWYRLIIWVENLE